MKVLSKINTDGESFKESLDCPVTVTSVTPLWSWRPGPGARLAPGLGHRGTGPAVLQTVLYPVLHRTVY